MLEKKHFIFSGMVHMLLSTIKKSMYLHMLANVFVSFCLYVYDIKCISKIFNMYFFTLRFGMSTYKSTLCRCFIASFMVLQKFSVNWSFLSFNAFVRKKLHTFVMVCLFFLSLSMVPKTFWCLLHDACMRE